MKQPEQAAGRLDVWSLWRAEERAATKVNRRMKASKREMGKAAKTEVEGNGGEGLRKLSWQTFLGSALKRWMTSLRVKERYFVELRRSVPTIIDIASGKALRTPELDKMREIFSGYGEAQEKQLELPRFRC
jgi:hypothetical protein